MNKIVKNDGIVVKGIAQVEKKQIEYISNSKDRYGRKKRVTPGGIGDYKYINIRVFPNNTVRFTSFNEPTSVAMTDDEISALVAKLDLEYKPLTEEEEIAKAISLYKEDGKTPKYHSNVLLAMAGVGPEKEVRKYYTSQNGVIYEASYNWDRCYLKDELDEILENIMTPAKSWVRNVIPGLETSIWNIALLHRYASGEDVEIIKVPLGTSVEIGTSDGSYRGSGGSWGQKIVLGKEDLGIEVIEETDNGFVSGTLSKVQFNGPAAFYTAAGDMIGEGRVHYKKLYVTC